MFYIAVGDSLMDVDGGGECGYDHCFARFDDSSAYETAAAEQEIARYHDASCCHICCSCELSCFLCYGLAYRGFRCLMVVLYS
jgi:hypothetical protein